MGFRSQSGHAYDSGATEPEGWISAGFNGGAFNEGWWRLLFADPDFTSRYRARFESLLKGDLSAESLNRIVDALASEVGAAADRNFQRWAETPPRGNSYAAELDLLRDFLHRRVAWLRTQLETTF